MVFQHFNLYANKTILENIMLAPRIVLHRDEDENKKVAMEMLDRVRVSRPSAEDARAAFWGATTTNRHCAVIGDAS